MKFRYPSYYRARIQAIHTILSENKSEQEKNSPIGLLKYGYVHKDLQAELESEISKTEDSKIPLTFTELCSFNTWFEKHPEKIAGKELLTSSREFPITIKGTKEDTVKF